MKNTLRLWSFFSRSSLTILGVLVFMTAVQAQKLYEIRSARHDMSMLGNDVGRTNDPVRLWDANGAERALWQFVHVQDQYYQILDKTGTFGLYVVNGNAAASKAKQTSNDFLWELIDADGRGELFVIRSKLNNRILVPGFDFDANIYVQDSIAWSDYNAALWRLVDRRGSGDHPRDNEGNEILPQVDYSITTTYGTVINMYMKVMSLCGELPGYETYENGASRPSDANFLNGFDQSEFSLVEGNQTQRIYMHARSNNSIWMAHPDNEIDMTDPFRNWESEIDGDSLKINVSHGNNSNRWFRGTYDFSLLLGTENMVLRAFFQERNNNGVGINNIYIQLPCAVTGITDSEVPILGYTTQPKIPYLILHDPPGDGSFSEFQSQKTICRKFEESRQTDSDLKTFAKIKVGVAGMAGFIVTTKFEFSVTTSIAATGGNMKLEKNAEETCVTVTNKFSTASVPSIEGRGDVFIGYGQDMNYGVFEIIEFLPDSCKFVKRKDLVFSERNPGEYRTFMLTKKGIEEELEALRQTVADSNNISDRRQLNNALNQIEAWEQVLQMNEENIANAKDTLGLGGTFNFVGNVPSEWSRAVKVTETNSFQTTHFLEVATGLEAVMEVGGSGISGGFEYKMKKTFGSSNDQTAGAEEMVKYTLFDSNDEDRFVGSVSRDPMYGTPVFKLDRMASKTSCPYEGGYALDQPRLTYNFATSDSLVITGVPIGEDAIFNIMICNDSREDRDYSLKLNELSNASLNAQVIAGGTVINNNPDGRVYLNVKAGECFEPEVIIRQTNQNRLNYPRLELTLAPTCEEEKNIASSLFVSVYFDRGTAVQDIPALSSLSVYPNPSFGEFNIDFTLDQPETASFEVYDLTGKLVRGSAPTYYPAGQHSRTVDMYGAAPGVYHLSIRTATGVISKRLVVQE